MRFRSSAQWMVMVDVVVDTESQKEKYIEREVDSC